MKNMGNIITIYDAKTNLSKYIKQAKAGKPVYIGSYGQQEVVLMSAKIKKTPIVYGLAKGKISKFGPSEAPDAEIQEMFYGKDWDKY
jgi:prevent-host-death family protein